MRTLAIVLVFLAGCVGSPLDVVANRYGFIESNEGYGSAVSVGGGRFLTATHVIHERFGLASQYGADSLAWVVLSEGDVTLVQTRLKSQEPVEFGKPEVGMSVYFVQIVLDSSIELYFNEAKVMRVTSEGFYIDKPVFPGCSGTGVFDGDGKLVGILVRLVRLHEQVYGGKALRIPKWMGGEP